MSTLQQRADYKSRFRILKGGKIARILSSALLLSLASSNIYGAVADGGGGGFVVSNNFTSSLKSLNGVTTQGISFAQTAMHGAHGHPGANRALNDKMTLWTAGDIAYDNHHENKDHLQLAEIGLSYKHNKNLTFSGAVGKLWGKSTFIFNGNSKSQGKYLAFDTDIKLPVSLPLYLTVSYLYGNDGVDVKRGYENAGSLDASYGTTSQNIQALRTRLQ